MRPRAMQEFDLLGPLAERCTKKKPRSALGCRSACLLCTLYSRFGDSLCLVALVHVAILPLKTAWENMQLSSGYFTLDRKFWESSLFLPLQVLAPAQRVAAECTRALDAGW